MCLCVYLQSDGGGLFGDTNSTITVLQSNFSFNNAAVRAWASDTKKPGRGYSQGGA